MPPGSMADTMQVDLNLLAELPGYGPDELPVFCGHQ